MTLEVQNNPNPQDEFFLHEAAKEGRGIKAAIEGEKIAKKMEEESGNKIDYNPKLLIMKPGARDWINSYVASMQRAHTELQNPEVLAKLEELANMLDKYQVTLKGNYVDFENPARERKIMEILDDPQVEKVLDSMAKDLDRRRN